MKRSLLYAVLLLVGCSLLGVSCSKHHDDDDIPKPPVVNPDKPDNPDKPNNPDPTYPTFDNPNWNVDNSGQFEYTMSVTAILPDSLSRDEHSSDKLAIFCGEDCRGIVDRLEIAKGKYAWIGLVYGHAASEELSFKYYSSKTKYIHKSTNTFSFIIDGHFGTLDVPETIGMKIVTAK